MSEWIIPCNPNYYDVIGAFNELSCIDWKQSAKNIQIGDIVYIYISRPVMAIKYKCCVNKVNLNQIEIDDSKFIIDGSNYLNYGNHMELELLKKYDDELLLSNLIAHGLKGNIQGPRRATESLSDLFSNIDKLAP